MAAMTARLICMIPPRAVAQVSGRLACAGLIDEVYILMQIYYLMAPVSSPI